MTIAVEGITVQGLWVRLSERPGFELGQDITARPYLWRCVLALRDVDYFRLPAPRPDLPSFSRFHFMDPETKHFIESVRFLSIALIKNIFHIMILSIKTWQGKVLNNFYFSVKTFGCYYKHQYWLLLYFVQNEVAKDIYPIKMVMEGGVMGSCVHYKTRVNITADVTLEKPSLEQVAEK